MSPVQDGFSAAATANDEPHDSNLQENRGNNNVDNGHNAGIAYPTNRKMMIWDWVLTSQEASALVCRLQIALGSTGRPTVEQVIAHVFSETSPLYAQVFSHVFESHQSFLKFLLAFFVQVGSSTSVVSDLFRYVLPTDQGRIDLSRYLSMDEYTESWRDIGAFRFDDGEWLWDKTEAALNQMFEDLFHFLRPAGMGFYTKDGTIDIVTMDTNGMKRYRDKEGDFHLVFHSTCIKNVVVGCFLERSTDASSNACRRRLWGSLTNKENSGPSRFRSHFYRSLEEDGIIVSDSESIPERDLFWLPHLPSKTAQARAVAFMLIQSIHNTGALQVLNFYDDPVTLAVGCLKNLLMSES